MGETTERRCSAVSPDGQRCGRYAGHDGDHTTLIASEFLPSARGACAARFPVGGEPCELPVGHDGAHRGRSQFGPTEGASMTWGAPTSQAPVAGADPRAWREMAERLERERGVFRAAHSDEVLALPPAGRAYVRALTGWSLNSDDATALVEEIDRQAAAARGAEGERERDELAFLRQQADALHRILPGNGDLVARAHFALSAPRPSAGPAAPGEDVADLVALSPLANLIRRRAHYVLRTCVAAFNDGTDAERAAGVIAVAVCMDGTLRDAMRETLADAEQPAARASDDPAPTTRTTEVG